MASLMRTIQEIPSNLEGDISTYDKLFKVTWGKDISAMRDKKLKGLARTTASKAKIMK